MHSIHDLYKEQKPGWTVKDTGNEIGFGEDAVQKYLQVARELLKGNALVKSADRMSTASGIVRRSKPWRLPGKGIRAFG